MAKLPTPYTRFARRYKMVWQAYDELGAAAHEVGPLQAKTRELVNLGMAITTLGFPVAMAALTWVEDILGGKRRTKARRR